MSADFNCDLCGKAIPPGDFHRLYTSKNGDGWLLCSPSCLVELAWSLKEAQEKLSKSKNV